MKKKYTPNRKKILTISNSLILIVLLITTVAAKKHYQYEVATPPITNFEGPLDALFAEAAKKNQNIFINTYSSRCKGCYENIKKALNTREVAEYYNKNFISYPVDIDNFQLAHFAELFNLNEPNNATQQVIFLSPNKTIISLVQLPPDPTPNDFLQYAKNAVTQKNIDCNPQEISLLQQKYAAQKNNPQFVEQLCLHAKACNPYQVPKWANEQIIGITTTDQIKEHLELIYNFSYDVESFANQYFIKYVDFFKQAKQSEIVNQKIKQDAYNTIRAASEKKDPQLLQKAIQKINDCVIPEGNKFSFLLTLQYYAEMQDWNNFTNETIKFLNKKGGNASKLIENSKFSTFLAYKFNQFVSHTDKPKLEFAINLVNQAIDIDNEPDSYYVKALLQRRMGKPDEASNTAKQGVELLEHKPAVFSEELKNFE